MNSNESTQRDRGRQTAGAVLAAALSALLVGCGGGGGAADPVVVTPTPVPDVAQLASVAIESLAAPVLGYAADIDDDGRVSVVYLQSNGARGALRASLGTPGAIDVAPTFSAATVIDELLPNDGSGQFTMATSPAGNAVAVWTVLAPCTANTYNTSGNCKFSVSARRKAGANWEAPVLVGDSPALLTGAIINDAGDILVALPGWARDTAGNLSIVTSVAWKANAATAFTRQLFPDIILADQGLVSVSLDRSGNMALAAASVGTVSTDIVTARGSLAGGFGSRQVLNTSPTRAVLEGMWGGVNGQLVVLWLQPGTGLATRWAAAADGPGQAWAVSDRGAAASHSLAGRFKAVVADNGDFVAYDLENCQVLRRKAAAAWQATAAFSFATNLCPASTSFASAISRTGNLVGAMADAAATGGNTGKWSSYDAAKNAVAQAFTTSGSGNGYLFGTPSTAGGLLLLAENGVASFVSANTFDTLPTAAAPSGTPGTSVNLWSVFVKPR